MKFKKIGLTGSTGVLGQFLKKKFKSYQFDTFKGDLSSKTQIKKWIKNKKFDGIFHLAAIVPTNQVSMNLKKAIKVNYEGTKILVDEIIKQNTTDWFMFTSTSHVYNFNKKRIKENSKTKPISKYGYTKLKAEKYILKKKNKIKICIVRIFSYTHYKQKNSFIVPSIYKKFKNNKSIKLENVNHVRDFVDIRDIYSAFKILFLKKKEGIYNLGSGKKTSLFKIINFFSKKFNKEYKIKDYNKVTTLVSDNSKLTKIGWRPKFSLSNTLKKFYHEKSISKSLT